MPPESWEPPDRGRRSEEPPPGQGVTTSGETDIRRTARLALACLREQGGERTLIRLARDVARREGTGTPTAGEIRAVYRRLYTDQLQQLLEAGFVTYSERDGTVRLASLEN